MGGVVNGVLTPRFIHASRRPRPQNDVTLAAIGPGKQVLDQTPLIDLKSYAYYNLT
jgi:hypothetical protein